VATLQNAREPSAKTTPSVSLAPFHDGPVSTSRSTDRFGKASARAVVTRSFIAQYITFDRW